MSAASASASQQSDDWHDRTQIGSSSTHSHSGSYGYLSYEGSPSAYRLGCILEADDIGQIAFETFMQTYVENLLTDDKTDVVGVAFSKAISEREAALLSDYKITADQYQKLPFAVRYVARYHMLNGTGKDDLKFTAEDIRKRAAVAGIKKSKLAASFLKAPIAAYISYFESKATAEKPIPLSSENLDDWIRIECLTGRTHVIIGLEPIENIVAYISGAAAVRNKVERNKRPNPSAVLLADEDKAVPPRKRSKRSKTDVKAKAKAVSVSAAAAAE